MSRTTRKVLGTLAATAIVVLLGVSTASAQEIYVQFTPAILGESTDAAHVNWIDAFALSNGLSRACIPGGGCSAPSLQDVSFLKGTDRASAELNFRAATGAAYTVDIDVCRTGVAAQECYYKLKLEGTTITSVQSSGSSCIDPGACGSYQTESVSLAFTKITWTYVRYDAKGGVVETLTRFYDVAKGSGG